MGLDVMFTVEMRNSDGVWERGEELLPNTYSPYTVALYEDEDFPKSQKESMIRSIWKIGRGRWLNKIIGDLELVNRGTQNITEETREYLSYWTDPELNWHYLTLRELEDYDWSQITEEAPGMTIRDELLPKLQKLGRGDDVRIIFGYNI